MGWLMQDYPEELSEIAEMSNRVGECVMERDDWIIQEYVTSRIFTMDDASVNACYSSSDSGASRWSSLLLRIARIVFDSRRST